MALSGCDCILVLTCHLSRPTQPVENCLHVAMKHVDWSSFQITIDSNWLKTLALVFQPIRSNTKTNRSVYFPALRRVSTGNF